MTLLSADSLTVRTADGTDLLSSVSLDVEDSETVLVCGPPGSGKTLVVKALKGLLNDREDLVVSGDVRRSGSVGVVLQTPAIQLVREIVEHDIAFGLENRGLPVGEIRERIDRQAAFLDASELLDRRVGELSQGETAMVALLGTLVMEPDVVILDEPLSSLDHRNSRLLIDAIDRLGAAGTAVVITEHDARDLLSRADRVLLIEDGRVVGDGPPSGFLRDLYEAGVRLPTETEVAIELGREPTLPSDDPGVELP